MAILIANTWKFALKNQRLKNTAVQQWKVNIIKLFHDYIDTNNWNVALLCWCTHLSQFDALISLMGLNLFQFWRFYSVFSPSFLENVWNFFFWSSRLVALYCFCVLGSFSDEGVTLFFFLSILRPSIVCVLSSVLWEINQKMNWLDYHWSKKNLN